MQRCNIDRARELLMMEGNVDATNTSGSSLTHVAIRTGDWRMLDLVLSFHPNVNVSEGKEVGGGTPLHAATALGNARMVKQLLKVHADPSIVDTTKSTALHICAKKGYADLAQALIQHCHVHRILGPNLEVFAEMTDKGGKSAHYWAREFGHHEMCETLPPKPYDPLEQFEAAIKDPENRVWQKESKKKKKGKKGGKKGGKKKKK